MIETENLSVITNWIKKKQGYIDHLYAEISELEANIKKKREIVARENKELEEMYKREKEIREREYKKYEQI